MQTPLQSLGEGYPIDAEDDGSLEPLINSNQIKSGYLFGIPLVSATKNPVTGKLELLSDASIEAVIKQSVNELELLLDISIIPRIFNEKQGLHWEMNSMIHVITNHRPIASLYSFKYFLSNLQIDPFILNNPNLNPSDPNQEQTFFEIPNRWLSNQGFGFGKIENRPLFFWNFLIGRNLINTNSYFGHHEGGFLPSAIKISYLAGFKNNLLPPLINQAIGIMGAIAILSMLGATYNATSYSQGIDQLSQSVGTLGPNRYQARIQDLRARLEPIIKKLKMVFGSTGNLIGI
jgi:hypothetical protein